MDGDTVPVIEVGFLCLDEFLFLLWVVDQCAEFFLLRLTDGVAEEFIDLLADRKSVV